MSGRRKSFAVIRKSLILIICVGRTLTRKKPPINKEEREDIFIRENITIKIWNELYKFLQKQIKKKQKM